MISSFESVSSDSLAPVYAAIESSVRAIADDALMLGDAQDVAAMTGAACNAWLFSDLAEYTIETVEEDGGPSVSLPKNKIRQVGFRVPLPGFWEIYGTPDLILRDAAGKMVIRDWKTVGKIDAETLERYETSWQKKIYLWAKGAQTGDEFRYCLVAKPDARNATWGLDVYEYVYRVEDATALNNEVEMYLRRVVAMIEAQALSAPSAEWVTHAPHGCRAYNRLCPRRKTCPAHNGIAPAGKLHHEIPRLINNSGIEEFLLCPERHRQNVLAQDEAGGSIATRLGQSFHSAMARIYRDAKRFHADSHNIQSVPSVLVT